MATLPTRIRQNIRDHIVSETSPLALKLVALKEVLGYSIKLDPEWVMLWKSLQAYYTDSATFVPSIADTVITWCEAFQTWLEGDENEEHVERLLDGLRTRSELNLAIEVSATASRPTTSWRTNKCVFVIALPSCPLPYRAQIMSGFSTDFLNLFTATPIIGATTAVTPEIDDPEEWAVLDRKPAASGIIRPQLTAASPEKRMEEGDDPLPTVSSIQRPEELMKKPPYWLVVRQEGRQKVVVQGSHAPSLLCLDEYLRRWCRGDVNRADRPPVLEMRLQESAFGLGLLQDTLTLEAVRGREVSAMLVLVFVENVLGYAPLVESGSAGCVWEFKRTKGFR